MKSHCIVQPQFGQILLATLLVRTCCGRNMDVHESCSVLVAANIGEMASAGVDVAAVLKHERSMVV